MTNPARLYGVSEKQVTLSKNPYGEVRLRASNALSYASTDAFGRRRISKPAKIFDSKFAFDNRNTEFSDFLVGGGTSTKINNGAKYELSVSSIGDKARRSSNKYLNYQPGKSQLILITGNFIDTSNCYRRIGIFDDDNGIFIGVNNGTPMVAIRSNVTGSVVEDAINQSSWNLDTLDGTNNSSNPSGIQLDVTKAQIFVIDYEWLGVGTVRIGFEINSEIYYVHAFDHANIADSVYMATPNLPVSWEIEALENGTKTLDAICATVISEGGVELPGISQTAWNSAAGGVVIFVDEYYPLISIRLNPLTDKAPAYLDALSIITSSGGDVLWYLVKNPNIVEIDFGTGASPLVPPTWEDRPNSYMQFDESQIGTWDLVSGQVLASGGYGSQRDTTEYILGDKIQLEPTAVYSLIVSKPNGSQEQHNAMIRWLEA